MNKNIKILQLGKFYPIKGGVEKVAYDLMTGLSERGVRCDMNCAAMDGSNITKKNENAALITLKSWKKLAATMISPEMIFSLRKYCNRYDIIHVHHPDPMAGLALFLSGFKGKVILHWHSDILKQKFLLKFYKPLQSWLIKRADLIVGTTPVYLKESPYLQKVQDKVECLPIGINPVEFDSSCVKEIRDKYKNKKIIFSLGRLVEYKGYEYLVEAAKYLSDDYVILIGGNGPLKDYLQDKINEEGLSSRVKLLGFVGDEDLHSYYGACDVFCLPSIYKTEAFGIVQIEAMSCGKPVVATNIPESGVSWVNKDGLSGKNVTPMNAKELAQAIFDITKDEFEYKEFSKGARERYEKLFTREQMISNCLRIYMQ